MECTVARCFWEQARVDVGVKLPKLQPAMWAKDLMVFGTARESAFIICRMWSLWMQRNDQRHGKVGLTVK
jgi:hypothetical protein